MNARTNNGLTLQGGFTTGAGTRDNCEITAQLPELLASCSASQQAISSCHIEEPWLWAWRGLANYIDAEDRRAGQRHHAVAAEHRGHQRPGVERPSVSAN